METFISRPSIMMLVSDELSDLNDLFSDCALIIQDLLTSLSSNKKHPSVYNMWNTLHG